MGFFSHLQETKALSPVLPPETSQNQSKKPFVNRKLPQKVEKSERRTLWALKRLSYQKYLKNYRRDHFGKLRFFRKQSHTNNSEIPFEFKYVCQNVNGYFKKLTHSKLHLMNMALWR